MNLIPSVIPETGDYFCTWAAQARVRPVGIPDDALTVRENMNEAMLFGENGLLSSYFDEVREDLIALLDDGWDVPYGSMNPQNAGRFGSLELDTERFPSFKGNPTERLKALSDRIKSLGYKGTGLWIACQRPFSDGDPIENIKESRGYWEKRARLCHDAGISYWKVDWGRSASADYREMMTECVRKFAPGLAIEHMPTGIFPPFGKYVCGRERFNAEETAYNRRILGCSDYLRTYDVLGEFVNAITMNRVALLLEAGLSASGRARGILNVEDAMYLGAGLGCSVGIMRHNRFTPGRERCDTSRYAEVVRTLKWHRIAPPFAIGGDFAISDELLLDEYAFPPKEPDSWPFVAGKTKRFEAPAVISRGCPLPEVKADIKPCAVASKNPNGAYSIALLCRTTGGKLLAYFPAEVRITGADADCPVGIFGTYRSLTITFDRPVERMTVMAQDLCRDCAEDITRAVSRSGCELTISGELINRLCTGSLRAGDDSAPGLVLKLI